MLASLALVGNAAALPAADTPVLTGQVTDLAGALPTDHPDVDTALDDLRAAREVNLYAVFVATNGGGSARDFARAVWNANDLGGRDILMVVTTDDQTVQFWQEGEVADVTDAELRSIQETSVAPLLAGGAYDQAVIAAASALQDAAGTPADPGPEIPTLTGDVTDLIGSAVDKRVAQRAIDQLRRTSSIDLSVLLIDEGNIQFDVFAEQVAKKNGLGGNDFLYVIGWHQESFFTEYGAGSWKGAALTEITDSEADDAVTEAGQALRSDAGFEAAVEAMAIALARMKDGEEIPVVQSSITDKTGVLDGDRDNIQGAITALQETTGIPFYVLFVKTTGNISISDFAGKVVDKNERLRGDYVLYTVAVDDRADVISKDERLTEVTAAEISGFLTDEVAPLIGQQDYPAAVRAAIEGIAVAFVDATPTPSPTEDPGSVPTSAPGGVNNDLPDVASDGGIPILPVLLVAGGVIGGVIVFSKARKQYRITRQQKVAEEQRSRSIADLGQQASELLLRADDGMREAEQEMGFAEAELAAEEVRPLREALAMGKEELAAAFEIQHQLQDAEPETPQVQQSMLKELVQRAQAAMDVVAEERQKAESIRDLERTAPDLLQRLKTQLPETDSQLEAAEKAFQRLQAYAKNNWEPVKDNVAMATDRLAAAKRSLDEGSAAGTDRRTIARSALSAQTALAQAGSLLDAVGALERSLLEQQQKLTADMIEVDKDLKEARAAVESGKAAGFEAPLKDAERDLSAAQALTVAAKPDIENAARFASKAAATATAILARAEGEHVDVVRRDRLLEGSLREAESGLQRAQAIGAARPHTVSVEARARLQQAEKVLGLAHQLAAGGQRDAALVLAKRADALSRAAVDPGGAAEVRRLQSIVSGPQDAVRLTSALLQSLTGGRLEQGGVGQEAPIIDTVVLHADDDDSVSARRSEGS